ncbi:DUF6318 family protein [Geodermatophilus nigrescens]|uniref:DUF6318 domain-containing protein n=1 Tax=Geodermatophilus nigrescens TaxID=1070870 RepID=A0A1M5JSR4_9ACTN|nr:DUF6318 family protein [Geodermatophilus nigrescens]SHG43033.1 hypothetical protein SAMN05444351_2618 [Geodermatophilus nigrescens]
MRNPGRRTRLAAAALTLATALLSACAAEAEAPSESLPTTSAPATTTAALPVVGPPDFPVPPEARTQDAAGAEAFLRYWIDLLNRQRAIPAGQPLRDLGPDCDECRRIANNYDEAAAAGNRYVGGEVTITAVAQPALNGAVTQYSFSARREPVTLVDSSGNVLEAQPDAAPQLSSGLYLEWDEGTRSWRVTSFQLG